MLIPTFEQGHRALAFLKHHRLDPTAIHYDLALSYVTKAAPDLAREIDEQTEGGVRLTYETAAKFIDRYLLHNPKAIISQRERTVAQQTVELGALTSGAHDLTSALERDVGTIVMQAEEWPKAAGDFIARLSDAERELAELRSHVAKLQYQIGGADDLRVQVDRDGLTQALNRCGAQDVIKQLTSDGGKYVMIMFSLDDLIELNERFGRSVGDNVLNALASTLRQIFQEQELIRWSGNEFVIVIRGSTLTPARLLAEDALATLETRRLKLRGSGEWIGIVTASAGIVMGHNETTTVVLERVRTNLLSASVSGGNRVEG